MKYYKRDISLMNPNLFPRTSLDKSIDNPDFSHSSKMTQIEKSDEEIINNVVSSLKKMGTKKRVGTN